MAQNAWENGKYIASIFIPALYFILLAACGFTVFFACFNQFFYLQNLAQSLSFSKDCNDPSEIF